MRTLEEIIIHCSDTPTGRDIRADDIDNWHKAKGWNQIGYHQVICIDGIIEEGRPINKIGAHCRGKNRYSIGICLIGRGEYNIKQIESLKDTVYYLKYIYPDIKKVSQHSDYEPKKPFCASLPDDLMKDLNKLVGQVVDNY